MQSQAGLEFAIPLLLPPDFWDYRHVLLHPALSMVLILPPGDFHHGN